MLDFNKIQQKWQKAWTELKLFNPEIDKKKKAFYMQVAYPYPSGAMHIGHARTYTITDVVLRYKRMKGYNVLMPMGWHVSGTPVIAGVELIKKRDEKTVKTMTENFRIPEKDLKELETPEGFVEYFVNKAKTGYKEGFKTLGLSIDWRRELKTIDPQYNKFIEWQYKKLHEKGYIIKGKYPVRYCPVDDSPVGDHDLKEGQGVGIQEFTLLKFKYDNKFLVAATLRPETVFGQTNLWVNPDIKYKTAKVDGEEWVLSKEAVEKLKHQKVKVEETGEISGKELLGKYCNAPGIGRKIIILPSHFCNPLIGTGIVTSVPSDAPSDYAGLRDLQKDPKMCQEFGLDYEEIKKIEIIPIIKTEKFGDLAAIKVVEDMKIKNQFDTAKLEEAKKIVYKEGFHLGTMNKNCGSYAGMKVEKAKDLVKKDLLNKKEADIFYELEGPIVCRCNAKIVVRVLGDQWFVKYSDSSWKEESKKTLAKMQTIPEMYRIQYENVFDWLENKPCTRSKGLGTKFPWDTTKIIEPLGDSTIYMAYFTISHIIKKVEAKKLNDEIFNYIFLGEGDPKILSENSGIELETLEEMRENFTYWYPLAFNVSAVELIPNHMSFSIFQHTAIFPTNKRQAGTLNLGMLVIDGQKMSSSKGNVVLISDIAQKIGSDMIRFFLTNFNEPWQEVNWRTTEVESGLKVLTNFIEKILDKAKKVNKAKLNKLSRADKWMLSKFNSRLKEANKSIKSYQLRKFLQEMCFLLIADIKQYEKITDKVNDGVYKHIIKEWVKTMSPFMPHVCEEIWQEGLKEKSFAMLQSWPEHDEKMIDKTAEYAEEMINQATTDIRSVLQLVKVKKPQKVIMFVSEPWKYEFFKKLKTKMVETRNVGEIIKDVMIKEHGKEISKLVPSLVKNPAKIPPTILTQKEELKILEENKNVIEKEFKLKVEFFKADECLKVEKAKQSLPGKPAILIE